MPFFGPPQYNLQCNVFNTQDGLTTIGPPVLRNQACNQRIPRSYEVAALNGQPIQLGSVDLVIGFPLGTAIRGLYDAALPGGNGIGHLVELPPGSGNLFRVVMSRIVGRGYPNAGLVAYCVRASGQPMVQ